MKIIKTYKIQQDIDGKTWNIIKKKDDGSVYGKYTNATNAIYNLYRRISWETFLHSPIHKKIEILTIVFSFIFL